MQRYKHTSITDICFQFNLVIVIFLHEYMLESLSNAFRCIQNSEVDKALSLEVTWSTQACGYNVFTYNYTFFYKSQQVKDAGCITILGKIMNILKSLALVIESFEYLENMFCYTDK